MEIYELISVELKKSILRSEEYDATELQRLLEIVYDEIYECQNADAIRKIISELSHVFHSVGDNSVAVLAFILMNKLHDLNGVKPLKNIDFNVEPVIDNLTDYIKSEIIVNNGQFHFLKHKKGSTKLGKDKLYATISYMLKYYLRQVIQEGDDIKTPMIFLINMWEISPKLNRLHEFYINFCSYLHKLHFSQQTQTVRDLAETSLFLGVRNKTLHYSFYVKMAVYSRQFNMIDSLLSAQLMMHGYNYTHQENELFISKSLLELFISLRNFRLYPYAERIRQVHKKLNIDDPYDKHQFDMAVFNMKLLMGDEEIFELANEYLEDNDVLEFNIASGTPWLVFLLNLKRNNIVRFETYKHLVKSLDRLESHESLSKGSVITDYKKSMSSQTDENKEAVLKGISNILQSRSFTDVGYELTMQRPAIINLLKNSIKSSYFEGVLIAHALSSGALGFDLDSEKPVTGFVPMKDGINIPSPTIFDDYLNHLSPIMEQSYQSVFLWLGSCDSFCYSVSLKNGEFSIYVNDTLTQADLRKWEFSQTESLAFNDSPNLKSILYSNYDYWENESREIIDSIPTLTDISEANNIILFRDVSSAHLPPNLVKNTSGTLLADLAPLHTPSSVELYLKSKSFFVDSSNIKLWAPIEEGDFPINIAFGKINELFNDTSLLKVTSLDPRCELNKDINIFISHGGKDRLYGFNSISPSDDKYFLNEHEIFGAGKVAVLFICHSGSSKSSIFATKLDGLVSKVLDFGYECVLAPAWSYNVILTGIWIRSFVDALNNGKSLSESTYHANMSVKSDYPGVGAYAAMHLFGNDGVNLAISRN